MRPRSSHCSNARKKEVLACRFLLLTSKSPCKEGPARVVACPIADAGRAREVPVDPPGRAGHLGARRGALRAGLGGNHPSFDKAGVDAYGAGGLM